MKLRNKKTGDIWEFSDVWENYTPKEPLIKDEGIRKLVIAWARINDVTKLKYYADENSLQDIFRNTISFNSMLELKDDESYAIAELCGEEKE